LLRPFWRMEVKHAFAVLRDKRVKIYQRADSLWNLIGDAADHVAAIRVPAQDDIREILPSKQVDNIRNMRRKIDSGRVEMRALAQTRKSRREHLMAGVLKAFSYSLPTPATMPRPVHKHVSGLVLSLFIRSCQINNPPSY